jgi:8-oxo-dGTP diphosphatase
MSDGLALSSRRSGSAVVSIDLVLMTYRDRRLQVRAEPAGRKRDLTLPWGAPARGEPLDAGAARIARRTLGTPPAWIEQVGAFADTSAHPGGSTLSVCYAGVVPWSESEFWRDAPSLPRLGDRQRRMVTATIAALRARLEQAPVVFSFLPRAFSLTELQQAYETLLDRRLHKASFRRALQAAFLVQPTGEWRSEGRGRPAQLYRYAPRKRKLTRRGVRLDQL